MKKSKCGGGKKKDEGKSDGLGSARKQPGNLETPCGFFFSFLRRRSDDAGAKGPLQEAYLHIKDGAEPSRTGLNGEDVPGS